MTSKNKLSEFNDVINDKSTIRVTFFSIFVIIFSIIVSGILVYSFTEREVVTKLKQKDLNFIAQSVTSRIESLIGKAKETSLILSRDPVVINWVESNEQNAQAQKYALQNIKQLANDYDYVNAFVVSNKTYHYWSENGVIIDTVSKNDADDSWFFNTINSKQQTSISIDYNDERQNTYVFVNSIIGDVNNPLGIAGVGFSLENISDYFQEFKYGESSDLWLIDSSGKIYLSDDVAQNGKYLSDFLPDNVNDRIKKNFHDNIYDVYEFKNHDNELEDVIVYPMESTDLKVVFKIERNESVSFLKTIKVNTGIAIFIALISIIFFFYFISKKIANPYKRAVELNQQLEEKIEERTRDVIEKNERIMDSIDYAKRIQESILPDAKVLSTIFHEYFLIWKPRDIVGGDFYWGKELDKNRYIFAIGDCTGHGVPGALMTMLSISALNQIYTECDSPAEILKGLNQNIKDVLKQKEGKGLTDDGLDIGICLVDRNKNELTFAGAKCTLYALRNDGLSKTIGNKKSVGNRGTNYDFKFDNNTILYEKGDCFYITTDGYIDQNGGPKDYSFGRRRFEELIILNKNNKLSQQEQDFRNALKEYQGDELQRDDITVIGFIL